MIDDECRFVRATIKYRYFDLKHDTLPDGWRGFFMRTFTIEADELGGRFTGEKAMLPASYHGGWLPESELIDIEPSSFEEYKQALASAWSSEAGGRKG